MWIIQNSSCKNNRLPIYYKAFQLDKKIEKCVLRVSALGIFHVKINGHEIEDYFMPGWTNYNHYANICSYDITEYVKKDNVLAIMLAEGWYSGRLGYTRAANVYGKTNAIYAEVVLCYGDGSEEKFSTDETWKVGDSNIVSSSLFDGETVDFRTPQGTDLSSLPSAQKYDYTLRLEPYEYEATRVIATLDPVVIYQDDEKIRLDFQQNFAGFISFYVEGEKDTEIIIKHAECLDANGNLYYENLRSVKAEDRLILSGGKDFFSPKFTCHGFRYAEITIKGKANLSCLKGVALSQQMDYTGKFECSDEIINQIYKNVVWGQKGNFISIPTDCPQRDERLGWTGDTQVFCNSAMFNCNCNRFLNNYLKLIRTDILPDGKIPSFVPFFIPVSASTAGVPGWADSICVIPYLHYLHYGDVTVLKENLPYAVRHVEYYLSKSKNYLLQVENPFGDWLSVKKADDIDAISQCFLGLSASLVSKMFAIVDDEENAGKYQQIYEHAKQAFREHYMSEDGKLKGDSQTIYALSLSVGFVTADEIKTHFVKSIERADWKLTTGFIGVKYLLPALCAIGETDLAYKIIKETEYPSWGYTIKQGATTIWERWNGYTEKDGFETPSMNSFNHYSLGSCAEWLYSHVLGIKLSADKNICISPSFSKELTFAKGEYQAKDGNIKVSWERKDDVYYLTVISDETLSFDYDFGNREILCVEHSSNRLYAVLK